MKKELLTAFVCLGMIATIIGCTHQTRPSKNVTEFEQISIIEEAMLDGYHYKVFQDKKTGRRILYWHNAMVVLPEKEQ